MDNQSVKKAFRDGLLVFQRAGSFVYMLQATDHNFTQAALEQAILAQIGSWDAIDELRLIIPAGVQIVGTTPGGTLLTFDGHWSTCQVTIENHGHLIGRGGQGGTMGTNEYHVPPTQGQRAILVAAGCNVSVANYGIIASGGGGGAGAHNYGDMMGGGGAPFGLGNQRTWAAAGYETPNPGMMGPNPNGRYYTGAGGVWGAGGANGYYYNRVTYGATAMEATRGAITWLNLGDVRGSRV